ncbi:MAG: DUF47 family protein [Verrucomicrobiales bacterium]|nr:DUF47 family protein [Verrucomicrobiales bacterium]
MFSLQRLMGKDEIFLDLLEACAAEAQASVKRLTAVLTPGGRLGDLDVLLGKERLERKLLKQIEEALVRTFITGLEREDIEALARSLYKLVKTTEKFAQRYRLVGDLVQGVDFSQQAKLIEEAVGILGEMIRDLRKLPPLERVKELNDRLEATEDAADSVVDDLVRDLYHANLPPGQFLARKDLYDLLEKLVDRCRDVGAIFTHVVMKNS